MDEAEAVALAKAGDVDAYAWLVRRHGAAAVRLASVICSSPGDAEDAAQEAFVKMFTALDRFRPDGSIRAWLMQIVANEAKNQRRSAQRRGALVTRAAALPGDTETSPEDVLMAAGEADAVLAAVASLNDRDRLVIGFRYFSGLSEREMADVLGCRQGTVKSRLARALSRLRPILAARGVTVDG